MSEGRFVSEPTQTFALARRVPDGAELVHTSSMSGVDLSGYPTMSGPQARGMAPDWAFDAVKAIPEGAMVIVVRPNETGGQNATIYRPMPASPPPEDEERANLEARLRAADEVRNDLRGRAARCQDHEEKEALWAGAREARDEIERLAERLGLDSTWGIYDFLREGMDS